jgi:hypothetical protein
MNFLKQGKGAALPELAQLKEKGAKRPLSNRGMGMPPASTLALDFKPIVGDESREMTFEWTSETGEEAPFHSLSSERLSIEYQAISDATNRL